MKQNMGKKTKIISYSDKFVVKCKGKSYNCTRLVGGKQGNIHQTVSVEGIVEDKYDGDGNYSSDSDCMKSVAKLLAKEILNEQETRNK